MSRQRTTTRVRNLIDQAREAGRAGPAFEALALIAERLARLVDTTTDDPGRQLTALRDLRSTFDAMGLDDGGAGSGGGGGGSDVAGGDPAAGELAELLGAGPTGGDAADA